MNKKMIMTWAFAAIGCSAFSQDDNESRNGLIMGVKVGGNYSGIYDSEGEDFEADPKFGFAAGVFIAIPVGKYLGIQPEVLFSQKGFSGTGRFMGTNYSFTRTTDYIDVPLLLAIKPFDFITVVAGPQYSYLLKQTDRFDGSYFTSVQEQEFKNDNLRKNTLCFTGGADINIRHFVLGLRAGWDIQNNHGDGSSTTPRYKNVWYQATIGVRLYNH